MAAGEAGISFIASFRRDPGHYMDDEFQRHYKKGLLNWECPFFTQANGKARTTCILLVTAAMFAATLSQLFLWPPQSFVEMVAPGGPMGANADLSVLLYLSFFYAAISVIGIFSARSLYRGSAVGFYLGFLVALAMLPGFPVCTILAIFLIRGLLSDDVADHLKD